MEYIHRTWDSKEVNRCLELTSTRYPSSLVQEVIKELVSKPRPIPCLPSSYYPLERVREGVYRLCKGMYCPFYLSYYPLDMEDLLKENVFPIVEMERCEQAWMVIGQEFMTLEVLPIPWSREVVAGIAHVITTFAQYQLYLPTPVEKLTWNPSNQIYYQPQIPHLYRCPSPSYSAGEMVLDFYHSLLRNLASSQSLPDIKTLEDLSLQFEGISPFVTTVTQDHLQYLRGYLEGRRDSHIFPLNTETRERFEELAGGDPLHLHGISPIDLSALNPWKFRAFINGYYGSLIYVPRDIQPYFDEIHYLFPPTYLLLGGEEYAGYLEYPTRSLGELEVLQCYLDEGYLEQLGDNLLEMVVTLAGSGTIYRSFELNHIRATFRGKYMVYLERDPSQFEERGDLTVEEAIDRMLSRFLHFILSPQEYSAIDIRSDPTYISRVYRIFSTYPSKYPLPTVISFLSILQKYLPHT